MLMFDPSQVLHKTCIFRLLHEKLIIAVKAVGESVHKPLLYYNNNLIGTINLLEVMAAHDCKNLFLLSINSLSLSLFLGSFFHHLQLFMDGQSKFPARKSSLLVRQMFMDEPSLSLKIFAVTYKNQTLIGGYYCLDISILLVFIPVEILVKILVEYLTTSCLLYNKLLLGGDLAEGTIPTIQIEVARVGVTAVALILNKAVALLMLGEICQVLVDCGAVAAAVAAPVMVPQQRGIICKVVPMVLLVPTGVQIWVQIGISTIGNSHISCNVYFVDFFLRLLM